MRCTHLFTQLGPGHEDAACRRVASDAQKYLTIRTGRVARTKVYTVAPEIPVEALADVIDDGLANPVAYRSGAGRLTPPEGAAGYIAVDKRPGVTDDEGRTLATWLQDLLGTPPGGGEWIARSRDIYWVEEPLSESALECVGAELLGNPLIHAFSCGDPAGYEHPAPGDLRPPRARVETVRLPRDDAALLELSQARLLSLNLEEMRAIRDHFDDPTVRAARRTAGFPEDPTDCEIEILAQTWSEHCKHKEFNALVTFDPGEGEERRTVDSLFKTYIVGATRAVAEQLASWGHDWLLKVFDDNAGVVRIDGDRVFVWKVETHNSPSGIDPYGGAITGILGNNRDPLGTGRGGGRLLFNTNVLCFGPPEYDRPLLPGQLHPRRVLGGVRAGIEDGGNQSGVPTVNGAILFDERFAGKPLVFCGTGAIAPAWIDGMPWWNKAIDPGDRIVTAGGRVGKDGIHGATFSSAHLDDDVPRSVVQIGSPITQKVLSDFLERAAERGWIKCATDNGAGGLSSSIGELARLSNGATVDLERVPLKYSGIEPWEIFVSESQERMTLVVSPDRLEDVLALAAAYDVEAADIGAFDASRALTVRHEGRPVATLDLEFLHDGVPRKTMTAAWCAPETQAAVLPEELDLGDVLARLMGSLDICSREGVIRQYDHEVKGRTIVKPLMGCRANGPQDAAVIRLGFEDYRGVAVANGIAPRIGDLDPYAMSAGAFDEAVRQIIAVGGRLPSCDDREMAFWSVNDNFCMPNVAFDPRTNPEGKERLGKLVRMCEALYDVATAYTIPLTSGKDSMKNDFHAGGVSISVPPTVLYSAVAGIPDVRKTVTTDFKRPGDLIGVVGETYHELGASHILRLFGQLGDRAPQVRIAQAKARYRAVAEAIASGRIASCHDISDGGLAVALVECAIGGGLGFDVSIDGIAANEPAVVALFSETPSRFVISCAPGDREAVVRALGRDVRFVGTVRSDRMVRVASGDSMLVEDPLDRFEDAWTGGLEGVV